MREGTVEAGLLRRFGLKNKSRQAVTREEANEGETAN